MGIPEDCHKLLTNTMTVIIFQQRRYSVHSFAVLLLHSP